MKSIPDSNKGLIRNQVRFLRSAALAISTILTIDAAAQSTSFLLDISGPSGERSVGGIAVDGSGVYVFGEANTTDFQAAKLFLRRYDRGGTKVWTRRFGMGVDGAHAVAATGGNVYVAGWSEGSLFLRAFSADGSERWTRQLRATGAYARMDIAADRTGIYIVGYEAPPFAVPSNFYAKYDADGTQLWSRTITLPGAGSGVATSVAAAAAGVYVTLYDRGGSAASALVRYDAAGQELWRRDFAGAPSVAASDNAAFVLAISQFDSYVRGYGGDGSEIWTTTIPRANVASPPQILAADASGVYVAGYTDRTLPGQCAAGELDFVIRRLDLTGVELWARQFGTYGEDFLGGVATDADSIYVSSSSLVLRERGAFLAKLAKSAPVTTTSEPRILWECVLNAASYLGGGVAPGEIVTILGSNIGPEQGLHFAASGERLATSLAETRVLFNGKAAPLIYVSETRTTAIVPYSVAGIPSVDVQVEYRGVRSKALSTPVLAARIGVFTADQSGEGTAAALNQDGTLNTPANPARPGSVISLFATGEGETEPQGSDGLILGEVLPAPRLPIQVVFTDAPGFSGYDSLVFGEVEYAGGAVGAVSGLLQINVRLHSDMPSGIWDVRLLPGVEKVEWGDVLPRSRATISVRRD
jgi:uncharacterized protein (TIGR03437 family)